MKLSITLFFLLFSLTTFACPEMNRPEHTERKGFKVDMPLDKNATGIMHQHPSDTQPNVTLNKDKTPRTKPSQADKKGQMHNS